MGSEIEQTRPASTTVRSWLDNDRTREMLRDALAGWMDPATFAAQCYLAARDPKLAGCSAESMFAAFLRCAEMGLLPSTHHRHVALIPRKVRDRNGRDTGEIAIDPMPQWQGFKALFEREPEVQQTRAVLVHTRDTFAIGVDGVPVHTFDPLDPARLFEHPAIATKANPPRECGLRGGYLVVTFRDATRAPIYHVVPAHKIHANRLCAGKQDVWVQWFEEMCLKTIYRDAWAKRAVPVSIEVGTRMAAADAADNAALENEPNRRGPRTIAAALAPREIAAPATIAVTNAPVIDATPAPEPTHEREPGEDDDAPSPLSPVDEWRARVAAYTTPQHVAASWAAHRREFSDADIDTSREIALNRLHDFASVKDPMTYLGEACAKHDAKAHGGAK